MEDKKLFVKTDVEAATDLTTLLIELFNRDEKLQKSPLFIVAESYGGKFAVTLGLSALEAIEAGKLKLRLGGNLLLNHVHLSDSRLVFLDKPKRPISQNTTNLFKELVPFNICHFIYTSLRMKSPIIYIRRKVIYQLDSSLCW